MKLIKFQLRLNKIIVKRIKTNIIRIISTKNKNKYFQRMNRNKD